MRMNSVWVGRRCPIILAALVVVVADVGRAGADDEAVLTVAEAKERIGERCTIEMTIRATNDFARGRNYYLDSEDRARDPNNLAIAISYRDAEAFRSAGIENPAEYYKGKTIRVTGKVVHEDRSNQTRVYVTDPSQIVVVAAPIDNVEVKGDPGRGS